MINSRQILSQSALNKKVLELSKKLIKSFQPSESVLLVGIHRRGVPLAHRLTEAIKKAGKKSIPVGTLDITLYRDDLDTILDQPIVRSTDLPETLTGKTVILVDDVLYTGRTVRAALHEIMEFGRPKLVRLLVLIERSGFRELPIAADFVGLKIKTKLDESVEVHLTETDNEDAAYIMPPNVRGKQ